MNKKEFFGYLDMVREKGQNVENITTQDFRREKCGKDLKYKTDVGIYAQFNYQPRELARLTLQTILDKDNNEHKIEPALNKYKTWLKEYRELNNWPAIEYTHTQIIFK